MLTLLPPYAHAPTCLCTRSYLPMHTLFPTYAHRLTCLCTCRCLRMYYVFPRYLSLLSPYATPLRRTPCPCQYQQRGVWCTASRGVVEIVEALGGVSEFVAEVSTSFHMLLRACRSTIFHMVLRACCSTISSMVLRARYAALR